MTGKKVFIVYQHDWEGLGFCGVYDNFDAAQSLAHALHRAHSIVTEVHEVDLQNTFSQKVTKGTSQGASVWCSIDQCGAI